MARIRSIKPDYWTDEKVVELSFPARLLFIGLWNFADDDGRMVYSPKRIKMQVFPADSVDVSELVGEIQRNGMVQVYVVDGVEYLQINNFAKHQKIDKRSASKFPVPPNPAEFPRVPPNPADSTTNPAEFHRIPPTEGNGRDQGREGRGEEQVGADAPPADTSPVIETLPLINGKDFEVRQSLVAELEPIYPKVDVPATVREMKGWLIGNPARRKTRTGIKRFITTWLHNEQQKAEAM